MPILKVRPIDADHSNQAVNTQKNLTEINQSGYCPSMRVELITHPAFRFMPVDN